MLDWIKKVDGLLVELNKEPQIKKVRSVPIEPVEKQLQTIFQDPALSVTYSFKGWVKQEESSFLQKQCYVVSLPPLQNPLLISLDKNAFLKLAVPSMVSVSEEVAEGFVSYIFAEVMHTIHTTKSIAPLGMQLQSEMRSLDQEYYFQVNVSLSSPRGQLWIALLFSRAFKEEWNRYFINEPILPLSIEEQEKIELELGLRLGEATLSLKELKSLQEGDFLLLENCLYDPKTKKGSLLVTLQDEPIFRAKLKDGLLKLVEYPPYEKVHPMNDDERDFYDDEDIVDSEEENSFAEETEEEEDYFPLESEAESDTEAIPATVVKREELPVEEIDVQVIVEVCRVRISAKELLELSAGKVLDLDVSIEKAVDLVVNGKRFGRAELMRVGDNLGVRILQVIGSKKAS
jgi:type III secretion system YscQ/HrcQ family protein